MKTKISLSIIGVYNIIIAVTMMFFVGDLVGSIVLSENTDVLRMCEVMHNGLSTAILIIGLTCLIFESSYLSLIIS